VNGKKNSVRVRILGEDYTVRTDASPERTRAVAQYFDRAVRSVLSGGHVVETHRAAILAGLHIAAELFDARESAEDLTLSLRALTNDVRQVIDAPTEPASYRPEEADAAT
jgi:cell division protein ZapA